MSEMVARVSRAMRASKVALTDWSDLSGTR